MQNTKISIVVPVYGCKTALVELCLRLRKTLEQISEHYEILLVNDSSPDDPWQTIEELAQKDNRIKGINLSRNFGQHYAITAGLSECYGEWVVVMDCDLQDQPEEILKFYNKAMEGYDIVLGQRKQRHDNFIKRMSSKAFYSVFSYLTQTKQDSTVANFGLYHKKVIHAILQMKDALRYFPTMVQWVGFKKTYIEVIHSERFEGKTSYNFSRLINLSIDVMLSFSDKPLRLAVKLGVIISLLSFIFVLFVIYQYLMHEIQVTGWATLVISMWTLSGLIIFFIGIAGLYISKTFEKVKHRPLFIIKEKTWEK